MFTLTMHRIEKPMKPSSILSQSILRTNETKRIIHLALSPGFMLMGLSLYYSWVIGDEKASDNLSKYYATWILVYSFVFPCSLISLIFNSSHYIEFLDIWTDIVNSNEMIANEYITLKKKTISKITFLSFTYEASVNVFYFIQFIIKLTRNNLTIYSKIAQIANQIVTKISLIFGWPIFVGFILETCVYMHSAFMLVDYHLNNNKLNQLDSNNIEQIILARDIYSKSINLIGCAEKLLSFLITGFYIYYVGYCLGIIGQFSLSDGTIKDAIVVIFRLLGESMYIASITHYLVNINKLASKIFESVYSLTLNRQRTNDYTDEINLFLLRVGRNDAGFRFANMFVMTPAFVSSLATISLTLVLTLPSLLR